MIRSIAVGKPFLSIVILTYNTRDLVVQCLGHFYERAVDLGWQLVVVDNGSSDDTASTVIEHFPAVKIIRSKENLGFAGGMNLGLKEVTGQVVVLLNSDVLVSAETLIGAAESLLAQSGVGALSPLLRTPDGEPQAFSFGEDQTPWYLFRRGLRSLLGLGPMHRWDVRQPLEVDWVSGACMLVRREVIEQVGLLDEQFFLYFEDNDWCLRMRKAGWRILYDPRFEVVHLGGASLPQRDRASQIYYQSLLRFIAKHYGSLNAMMMGVLLSGYLALRGARVLKLPCSIWKETK